MKKTLLSAAVLSALVASTAATAATVYDKDGTTLNVNGRIETQWYNAGFSQNMYSADRTNDSSIYNWARMGMDGRSKLNDYASAFGFMEFDIGDGDRSASQFSARDQYIGVDFGKFGAVKTGRYHSLLHTVVIATDVLDGDGMSGKAFATGNDRNAGKLTYTWNGYGVLLGAEYQAAKDDYIEQGINFDAESGYSVIAGYTTPSVLFGPISIKAGYSYISGQDDSDKSELVDNLSGYAASLAWGVPTSGLYLATEYSYSDVETRGNTDNANITGVEFVTKYSFDSGLSLATGYQFLKVELGDDTVKSSQIPLVAEYDFNPNFKVYAQASFGISDTKDTEDRSFKDFTINPTHGEGNAFAVGARYTF